MSKMGKRWERLLAKMRQLPDWTVTIESGVVTIRIGGWLDAVATFAEDDYVECLSFYEGYTSVESRPGMTRRKNE